MGPSAGKRASGGRRRPFEEMGEKSQKRARQVAQILDPGLKESFVKLIKLNQILEKSEHQPPIQNDFQLSLHCFLLIASW